MTQKEKNSISLVKTDYDDFKDLSFFLEQQRKAEAMLREVEDFKKSFVMSKMVSMAEWVKENPTYGLTFFEDPHLCISFKPNGLFGFIFVDYNRDLHWFSPNLAHNWHQDHWCDHYYLEKDNYPKDKRKVLDQFFINCHRHLQEMSYGLAEWVDTGEKDADGFKKQEAVPFTDDSQSIYILDWKKYTKPEVVKEIESEYARRCEVLKLDVNKFRREYEIKNHSKVLLVNEIIDEMHRRFATPISYIRDLYSAHPDILCEYLAEQETGRWFHFKTSENNCVIYKGRPRWVSNNLDKVKITTSEDRKKIICEFKDEEDYKRFNFDSFRILETRTCELTYSAKNNELTDYKVYSDQVELCDRRNY